MPVYEYSCPQCRNTFDMIRPMAQYQADAFCPSCNSLAHRVISPVRVAADYEGYECPVSGKWIEGRKAHEENLKRTGCRVFEEGERKEFLRNKERRNKEFDAMVEESVAREIAAMPPEKQQALAREFEHGADIVTTRTTV